MVGLATLILNEYSFDFSFFSVSTSGARVTLHLLRALQRKGGGLGIATLCIGGGQGGAMLVKVEGGAA